MAGCSGREVSPTSGTTTTAGSTHLAVLADVVLVRLGGLEGGLQWKQKRSAHLDRILGLQTKATNSAGDELYETDPESAPFDIAGRHV